MAEISQKDWKLANNGCCLKMIMRISELYHRGSFVGYKYNEISAMKL